jgi:hypothetical protein
MGSIMKIEHLPEYNHDKELIKLLENIIDRHNERLHKLEDVIINLYCCTSCAAPTLFRKRKEGVFFGKEYLTREKNFAPYERSILKVSQAEDGSYWKTLSYVDRNGYTCEKSPASQSLIETLKYPNAWHKQTAS